MIIIAEVVLNITHVSVKIFSKLKYFVSKGTDFYDCFYCILYSVDKILRRLI